MDAVAEAAEGELTMADLIDRNSLIEKLHKRANDWRGTFSGDAYRNAVQMIKKEPAVDAVEVVRCKDCKWWQENQWSDSGEMMCKCWCDWLPTEADDFCSYGERRSE